MYQEFVTSHAPGDITGRYEQGPMARSHSTHSNSVEVFLENSKMMPSDATEEAQKAELQSDSYRLIERFLELARQYCEDEGLEPGSDEALAVFEEAHTTATSIVYTYEGLPFSMDERKALSPDQVTEKLALRVPSHVKNLATYAQKHGKLGAPQEWLSQAVAGYVSGRFKSPQVDHVLAKALTQVEMVAYMDEMLWKNPLTGTSKLEDARPSSVVRALWNVSKLVIVIWIVSTGIAALPWVVPALPVNVMLSIGLGIGALGTIAALGLLVLGVIAIVQEKPNKRREQNSILAMINHMNGFFIEFNSAGPFSTARFRERVEELANVGVVWPSGLFVLLDDMEERGVRTF